VNFRDKKPFLSFLNIRLGVELKISWVWYVSTTPNHQEPGSHSCYFSLLFGVACAQNELPKEKEEHVIKEFRSTIEVVLVWWINVIV
jgi:hypothetical protein